MSSLTIVSCFVGAVETDQTRRATLLPDPEPRPIRMPVISVDDHLIEPRDLFEGRLPAALQEGAPKVVELEHAEAWVIEAKYEDEAPLFGNLSLHASFDKVSRVGTSSD